MRLLAWHVDYFKCRITERGRSPLVEEYDDPETVAEDALLVLISVEKGDEAAPEAIFFPPLNSAVLLARVRRLERPGRRWLRGTEDTVLTFI